MTQLLTWLFLIALAELEDTTHGNQLEQKMWFIFSCILAV
jgi:hypothetical protein